ncbi:exonuclease SbcCD subunit D [Cryobacterium tepidiphilum]|uniref:Nuclease SbcCD subunit D n=1 Tax=Cryobacterium tepidiphilum TaxID=2486026 RepID=A0A3M8LCQ5_9MICO|nr:exonuclease SbcCD subunit D [Cryobacterium tepidiphilum]RNE62268.1 exonuclease SbcCD subunit D [Cryobacterium tepidiphilum]
MKILHTSDWHIGRTFHGHSTVAHLRVVLDALVDVVREHGVDVVVVAGDIFDSATPAAEYYTVLSRALAAIREAGASVVMTSGNHDSAARLGFMSEFAGLAGVHVMTRPEQHDQPVTFRDEHGDVHVYGIPYLEPALVRHLWPEAPLRTHAQVLEFAMDRVRADHAARGGRAVVLSHCFAVDVPPEAGHPGDGERDITAGGLDYVPLSVFDGPDYVALGHIHGRARLSERVRYSGAPLHYSFSEAGKARGAWLVDLGADGLGDDAAERIRWVDLPVPRALQVITGDIDELLTDAAYTPFEDAWVAAVVTDQVRPMDAMRRLQERFPWCVTLDHRPAVTAETVATTYAERVKQKSDHEIVAGFLEHVRNGVGPTPFERELLADVITEHLVAESIA